MQQLVKDLAEQNKKTCWSAQSQQQGAVEHGKNAKEIGGSQRRP